MRSPTCSSPLAGRGTAGTAVEGGGCSAGLHPPSTSRRLVPHPVPGRSLGRAALILSVASVGRKSEATRFIRGLHDPV